MKNITHSFFEFFTLTIVLRYIVAKWIAEQTVKLLKKLFIKTEKDLALYLHYRNNAFKKKKAPARR